MFSGEVSKGKLAMLLKGKKVCLVGPASSMIGSKQKDLIESYDVVARVNGILFDEKNKEDVGLRTDIYYSNKIYEVDQKNLKNVPISIQSIADVDQCNKENSRKEMIESMDWTDHGYRFIDSELYNKVSQKIGMKPHTGILAYYDLLSFDISELYVTGYTFYRGKYYGYVDGYRSEMTKLKIRAEVFGNRKGHDSEKEFDDFIDLASKDKRIKVDNILKMLMNTF